MFFIRVYAKWSTFKFMLLFLIVETKAFIFLKLMYYTSSKYRYVILLAKLVLV